MTTFDTIAALATPPGRGGVGIVRVSGPATRQVALGILATLPSPRIATVTTFRDGHGTAIDQGIALFFPGPASFTGEDVLELQGHGGPVVMDLLLARTCELGARLARPGEFSERAFLNGKLDLTQAEAIADLIHASTTAAARGALNSLTGAFSRAVHSLVDRVVELRTHIEAVIDFPDEDIDPWSDTGLVTRLDAARAALAGLLSQTQQGAHLRDGLTVVLAGPPNAGKSSLLNALAGVESAIVSATPGTTRDLLRERISIDGLPLHVIDTAGLRPTRDDIEAQGIARAKRAMEQADHVLILCDDQAAGDSDVAALRAQLPPNVGHTLIRNKVDLTGREIGRTENDACVEIAISVKTDRGLEVLREHLKALVGYQPAGEGAFTARRRHVDALHRARHHLDNATHRLRAERAGELAAEELRLAQRCLGEITGEFTADDLLGRIFGEFCIGK